MSTYASIADVSESASLRRRLNACAAQEGKSDPEGFITAHRWTWAAAPGWGAAFDSASAAGNPDPGADPAVITDAMILTEVQLLPPLPGGVLTA